MAQILSQRTVVRDGWHNMGNDLCYWRDNFWLVHMRTSAHNAPDGVAVVSRSADLVRWDPVAVISTPNDTRDPKIIGTDDELLVFSGDSAREMVQGEMRLTVYPYVSASDNGYIWSIPEQIHKRNYWMWRVCVHEGAFYCAEKAGELLKSEDGRGWERIARIPDGEGSTKGMTEEEFASMRELDHRSTPRFNEADLIFRPDGELWCLSRTKLDPDHPSLLYYASPPYRTWVCVELGIRIHCPVLCESAGKVYVAGRRNPAAPWIPQQSPVGTTGIFLLDKKGLTPVCALPSDGDAAYPGLLSLEPDRLIISYYSQHAYTGGVLEAESKTYEHLLSWGSRVGSGMASVFGPSDIYIAEIDVAAENVCRNF